MTPYYAFAGTFTTAGTSPDGDTIRFRPDHPHNLSALATAREPRASASGSSATIRLEAIDAPELHYSGTRQRRSATARTRLLHRLGFRTWALAGDRITTTGESRGWVIARHLDVHNRVIGFVYAANDLDLQHDGPVSLTRKTLLASANADMLATGAAYYLAYASLGERSRAELRELALDAPPRTPRRVGERLDARVRVPRAGLGRRTRRAGVPEVVPPLRGVLPTGSGARCWRGGLRAVAAEVAGAGRLGRDRRAAVSPERGPVEWAGSSAGRG